MNTSEHAKEMTRLTGNITRTRNALQKPMSLAAKIEAKTKVRNAEEALRQHKLNFFELTGA